MIAGPDPRWWTWAGFRANATHAATPAARLSDLDGAVTVLAEPVRFVHSAR